jgi:hypothetical protein
VKNKIHKYFILFFCAKAPSGPWPLHYHGFMITLGHTTFGRTPMNESSIHGTDLYMTTRTTQKQRDFHAPGRILTGYPSKQGAADPRLRMHGNWNQPKFIYLTKNQANGLYKLWHRGQALMPGNFMWDLCRQSCIRTGFSPSTSDPVRIITPVLRPHSLICHCLYKY